MENYHQISVPVPFASSEGAFGVSLALNLALSIWITAGCCRCTSALRDAASQRHKTLRLSFQSSLAIVVNLLTVADAGVCL